MKNIKFRAWDKEKKVFVKGMLCFEYDDFDWVLLNDNYEQILCNYNGELCQYTGLKDKNGVEIYEGDIYIMIDKRLLSIVVWNDSGFKGKQKNTYGSFEGLEYNQRWIEVIGNIYENPELLK